MTTKDDIMPDGKEMSLNKRFEQLDEYGIEIVKQGGTLISHASLLQEHGELIRQNMQAIEQVQNNALRLENTIMVENRDTRNTIVETNKQLHELIKGLMGYKSGNEQLDNQLQVAKVQSDKDLKVARVESYTKIVSYLSASGGILYYLFG